MPITLDDPALRAFLHTDIDTAWSTAGNIFDDPVQVPETNADLPRAYVQLQGDILSTKAGSLAGLSQWSNRQPYKIVGQFAWPAAGTTTIEAAKVANAQAFLNLLTATFRYHGFVYWDVTITIELYSEVPPQNRYYQIAVTVTFEGVS